MFKTVKSRLIAIGAVLVTVGSFAALRLGTVNRVFAQITPTESLEVSNGIQTSESISSTEITTIAQEESAESSDIQATESQTGTEVTTTTTNTNDKTTNTDGHKSSDKN